MAFLAVGWLHAPAARAAAPDVVAPASGDTPAAGTAAPAQPLAPGAKPPFVSGAADHGAQAGTSAGGGAATAPKPAHPAQVRIGAYLMSLYDLNPTNHTFAADFWLWALHDRNLTLLPLKTLEPENARTFSTSLEVTEEHDPQRYHVEKIRGVFGHNWDVENFPFDHHELKIHLSEGEKEAEELAYVADTANTGVDPTSHTEGWRIERISIETGVRTFNTSFGEPGSDGHSNYAQAIVSIFIAREPLGIFLKLHAAVYIAFLVGMVTFFLDSSKDGLFNGRISLLTGMIFAVVINNQRVATAIGQTGAFTLPDKFHIFTLIELLCALVAALVSRHYHLKNRSAAALLLDKWMAYSLATAYVLANALLIGMAMKNG